MSRGSFGCYACGSRAAGMQWVEARDAAKHPMPHRIAPAGKRSPAPNANNGEAENLTFRL